MADDGEGTVTIFELTNETLKEFFICSSSLPLEQLRRSHQTRPPSDIAHWTSSHRVLYQEVEAALGPEQARAFLKHYAQALARTGWKVLPNP
jgi:hypothetical protein